MQRNGNNGKQSRNSPDYAHTKKIPNSRSRCRVRSYAYRALPSTITSTLPTEPSRHIHHRIHSLESALRAQRVAILHRNRPIARRTLSSGPCLPWAEFSRREIAPRLQANAWIRGLLTLARASTLSQQRQLPKQQRYATGTLYLDILPLSLDPALRPNANCNYRPSHPIVERKYRSASPRVSRMACNHHWDRPRPPSPVIPD